MRITLVGNLKGRRVVLWGQVAKIVAILAPLPIIVAEGVYILIRKEWSWQVFLLGLGVGVFIALIILLVAICTPIYKLPILSDKK